MCIKEVTAWAYAGQNYDTERDAVWAAIDATGKKIVKENAANPGKGLISDPDLPKLLIRYAELTKGEDSTAANSSEGTRAGELEGTRARPVEDGMVTLAGENAL